jgi:hypothetical protein
MKDEPKSPSWKSHWSVLGFLLAFTIILVLVSYAYLFPAIEAASEAAPKEKKTLAAYSTLLLTVVLFVLGVLLVITFRVGRFFFPRGAGNAPRTKTQYVDAWAESAKRVKVSPEDDEDDDTAESDKSAP